MKCDCLEQPTIRRVDGTVTRLFPGFQHVDAMDWRCLLRCPACGQLWAVDEWDKYQIQFAAKVEHAEDWDTSDEALRKAYLAQSRGENSVEKCMWHDCKKNQLNGSAYCVNHLYATGVRI